MKLFKKVLKICTTVFVVLLLAVYMLFVYFSSPKSDDEIYESFYEVGVEVSVAKNTFRDFKYRTVSLQKAIDTNKTTLVFVHGAIGSAIDFKSYMTDSLMRSTFNMVSYDRVGYNYNDETLAQKSLKLEVDLLKDFTKNLNPKKTVFVGYSYGGPIVLAMKEKYKQIVLLAPAVYSKVEPMPFMLNFYTWKITRWLVPHVWKSASLEKVTHKIELQKYEQNWKTNPSKIIAIHGDCDGIAPYENSLFLQGQFPKNQFELKTINDAGHSLVWSNFQFIKKELLTLTH
jgi:pimeloyl-ACP methyl ester carboxylesterase